MTDDSIQAMAAILEEHTRLIEDLTAGRAEDAEKLDKIQTTLRELVRKDQQQKGYEPVPPPRWWQLEDAAREEAIELLREWVNTVYKTSYEQFGDNLDDCWDQHPLCLFILDWLSEWHKYLYLRQTRGAAHLVSMAEWHTRFLPLASDLLKSATKGCPHQEAKAILDEPLLAPQLPAPPGNGHANGTGNGRANGARR